MSAANPAKTTVALEVTPVVPPRIVQVNKSAKITVPAGQASVKFDSKMDKSVMKSGGMITCDIVRNREYLGQKIGCFTY
jgi:hypothetical protein